MILGEDEMLSVETRKSKDYDTSTTEDLWKAIIFQAWALPIIFLSFILSSFFYCHQKKGETLCKNVLAESIATPHWSRYRNDIYSFQKELLELSYRSTTKWYPR